MPVISFSKFSGVAPRVSPTKLAPDMAQKATNVRLLKGTLGSWNDPLTVVTGLGTGASTIYRFGQNLTSDTQYWFTWLADVDIVKGSIADDSTERTYFTHPTLGACMTNNSLALTGGSGSYPWNHYKLGVPAPSTSPGTTIVANGTGTAEMRSYVYTYVTSFGEEGPPSAPSAGLTVNPSGSTVRVNNMQTAPAGYPNITAKRIYRTFTGSSSTEFQFVDEIPASTTTYDDTKSSDQLQETIPSVTWEPPPSGCFGLTQMANGIMLVFKGYDIYPSEAYRPHAYPAAYALSVNHPIVGAAAIGTSAVICTTGTPYLLTGSDPSAMSLVKLESKQACLSKSSIVAGDGGVAYASADGLIFVSVTGQVSNLTANLFSRDEWMALNPSSLRGYWHDGRYYGFYNNGATSGGFIFDPTPGSGAFTYIDTYAEGGYVDPLQDALFLKVGTTIRKWHSGASKMTYSWKSAMFESGKLQNPGCAQVIAAGYPVTFKLYADGALKHTQAVADSKPFWLPAGYRARFLEVELIGSEEVYSAHLASSMSELQYV